MRRPARSAGLFGDDRADERAARPLEAQALGDLRRHRLELAPSHGRRTTVAPPFAEATTACTMFDGDGEADAVRAAGAREDRGVDADEPAGQIDQRAAGIAGIDGGVGLDEELVVGDADLGARQRRDDAVGDGLADAERIADGEHEVADLERVGIAEVDRR